MRSTLPALFKATQVPQERKSVSPHKQGPYYDLNLTISHNTYRTKIINPHSSSNAHTIDLNKSAHLKPLLGRYGGRAKRATSVGIDSQTNQGQAIGSHSMHRLSQIDNVKFNWRRVQNLSNQLEAQVLEVPEMNSTLLVEIKQMGAKLNSEIDELTRVMTEQVSKLRDKISGVRRQTNMEQKLFKKELAGVNDELIDCVEIIRGVEEQRAVLKRLNF